MIMGVLLDDDELVTASSQSARPGWAAWRVIRDAAVL
jgi:hypothetical protein